jgi:hypothetical protein
MRARASKIYCQWLDYTLYFSFVKTVRKAGTLRCKGQRWHDENGLILLQWITAAVTFPISLLGECIFQIHPDAAQRAKIKGPGQTIKVSPDLVEFIHMRAQNVRVLDFALFLLAAAAAWEKHPEIWFARARLLFIHAGKLRMKLD